MTFYILYFTFYIQPIDQWTNGPMDQWSNGPMDQWTNGPISLWPKRYLFHFSAHLEMNMSSMCTVSNYTQNRGVQIFSTWLLWKCQHLDGGWSFIMCWTPQQECIPYNHPHIVLGLNSITMQVHWRLNKAAALHHHDTPVLCIHKAWVTVHHNLCPFTYFTGDDALRCSTSKYVLYP